MLRQAKVCCAAAPTGQYLASSGVTHAVGQQLVEQRLALLQSLDKAVLFALQLNIHLG